MQGLQGTKIALLIDFDNVILGVDDPGFDVELVVNALRSRGVVVMGRAYGDWYRHHRHRRKLMEQGIELVETPVFGPLIKNSADIRIVLDGIDIATSHQHIDTFCLVSGDSDFLPLIKRLQLLGKNVIVIAGNKFTSDLVRRNCNEYVSYENLLAESVGATEDATTLDGAFHLLSRAINTLEERGMDVRSSTVKQMMLQLNPVFSERTFGCYQFKQFLDRAVRAGLVALHERDNNGEHTVELLDRALFAPPALTGESNGRVENAPVESAPEKPRELRPTGRRFSRRDRDAKPEAKPAPAPVEAKTEEAPAVEATAEAPVKQEPSAEKKSGIIGPISTSALTSRPGVRRGRLRFSAKNGRTITQSAESVEAQAQLEEESVLEVGNAAPVDEALDVVQSPEEIIPTETSVEEAAVAAPAEVAETATEQDTTVEADAAQPEAKTAKRGGRGGRRRKGAKTEEAALVEEAAAAPVAEAEPQTPSSVEATPEDATLVAAEASVDGISASADASPEAGADKKKTTRGRRGGAKRTAARRSKAADTADVENASSELPAGDSGAAPDAAAASDVAP